MPRGKKQQYVLADDGAGGLSPVAVASGTSGVPSISSVQASSDRAAEAGQAFLDLLYRPDGWIRVVGGPENKLHYYKYKFSSGPYKGKYVMYVAPCGCWEEGICGLADKLHAVDRGELRPAHDTFYDPR